MDNVKSIEVNEEDKEIIEAALAKHIDHLRNVRLEFSSIDELHRIATNQIRMCNRVLQKLY